MANVKIALRVRPLSEKERYEDNSQIVVTVEDRKSIAITNLKVPINNAGDSRSRVKRFSFDYCFDSKSPLCYNYADQEKIYETVGDVVLRSLASGRDACVLAYGQSSSGKTYTMQGTNSEPGLTPRLCRALMTGGDGNVEATVSYFEIYNERVRDLLTIDEFDDRCSINQGHKDLRVREHPKKGPYVEALSEILVKTPEELCSIWSAGAKKRRTASTSSNQRSSRSHAFLSIKRSLPHPVVLTLLDLAGSERPSRVNQSLPRQKEGANINKSLVALANVISALVIIGNRGVRYVPFRDSILTWLLKDTLSGRATTVMIATVSPAASCYSETVNTMRWASRAARIPTNNSQVVASEPAHERAIRQLRAEVERLKSLLAAATLNRPILSENVNSIKTQADTSESSCVNMAGGSIDSTDTLDGLKDNSSDGKLNTESIDSLGSSRLSVASEDTLLATKPSNLIVPRLLRTGSVHEVKPLPPLRNKKRQYSSHEVLSSNDKSQKPNQIKAAQNKLETKSESADSSKQRVSYQPFNKRAVIVASVTDRLYSKLKKKEEMKAKTEPIVEKRPTQNLTELEICNNARKKLLDISHKALKVSRRFRMCAAETQTEKPPILLYRETGTDVPDGIEIKEIKTDEGIRTFKNIATYTESRACLCKEVSVGSKHGSVFTDDKSIETDKVNDTPLVMTRTCGNMTDNPCILNTSSTQTGPAEPKKHSSFTKYLRVTHDQNKDRSRFLNISISHDFPIENDDVLSDDSLENEPKPSTSAITAPPDLLSNHNSNDNIADVNQDDKRPVERPKRKKTNKLKNTTENNTTQTVTFAEVEKVNKNVETDKIYASKSTQISTKPVDFVDDVFVPLPRIYFNDDANSERWPTMKNMILGRTCNSYPYNIKISPIKDKINKRKSSKTVSWKSEHPGSSKDAGKDSESDAVESDDTLLNQKEEPKIQYFKGIHCWEDRMSEPQDCHRGYCKEYAKATTSFISEATNLVTTLSRVSNKLCDVSPNRSTTLRSNGESSRNPCSRIINEKLVYSDEHLDDIYEKDFREIENNLTDSLNRLQTTTKTSNNYFNNLSNDYNRKFGSRLPERERDVLKRRSPSKYLRELLEIRKDLVDSTMRDEDISKHFHML